jgi:hypothetical protein
MITILPYEISKQLILYLDTTALNAMVKIGLYPNIIIQEFTDTIMINDSEYTVSFVEYRTTQQHNGFTYRNSYKLTQNNNSILLLYKDYDILSGEIYGETNIPDTIMYWRLQGIV